MQVKDSLQALDDPLVVFDILSFPLGSGELNESRVFVLNARQQALFLAAFLGKCQTVSLVVAVEARLVQHFLELGDGLGEDVLLQLIQHIYHVLRAYFKIVTF